MRADIEDKTCTPCKAGTYSTTSGATSVFSCIQCVAGKRLPTAGGSAESACIKCEAGKYSLSTGATYRNVCPGKCPPASTSKAGSTSQLNCTCMEFYAYQGPNGGPCKHSREKMRSKGIIWFDGNDSFLEEIRVSASIYPWPQALKDDALTHHVSTWASEAAHFWGDQGPRIESESNKKRERGWRRAEEGERKKENEGESKSVSIVLRDCRYKDAFWKDATGLGAWIEVLRKRSSVGETHQKYRQVATAIDEWRLEDAARYWSNEVGHDGREVWPSTALISNALVWHDGIVVGQSCMCGSDE